MVSGKVSSESDNSSIQLGDSHPACLFVMLLSYPVVVSCFLSCDMFYRSICYNDLMYYRVLIGLHVF